MRFTTQIKAQKKRVWQVLWEDATFRDWASLIDEGMHLLGEMKEGNEVQFISSVSGYGVTSLIEKLVPNEYVLFRQMADTQNEGEALREKEWTGGAESYTLEETNGITTVTIESDVPDNLVETFEICYPKALERIKHLAEN